MQRPHPLLSLCLLLMATAVAAQQPPPSKPSKKPPTCPVDQKFLRPAPDAPTLRVHDTAWQFCSPACREKFLAWPEKYVRDVVYCPVQPSFKAWIQRPRRAEVNNGLYYLCCDPCVGWIKDKPWLYFRELPDPVTGKSFAPSETSPRTTYQGQVYLFESAETRGAFDKEPARYAIIFKR